MVIGGLKPDTTYSITVAAYTTKGDGARSKPKLVVTKGAGQCNHTLFSVMARLDDYCFFFATATAESAPLTSGPRDDPGRRFSRKCYFIPLKSVYVIERQCETENGLDGVLSPSGFLSGPAD